LLREKTLVGEISALASALCWALSNVLIKSQTDRIDAVALNILRSIGAAVFLVLIFIFSGKIGDLSRISLYPVMLLVGSSVVGLGLGDTLYFRSMGLIGVARSFPITNVSVLFTAVIAYVFLKENLSWLIILGGVLIIAGVYLIAAPPRGKEEKGPGNPDPKVMAKGTGLVLGASACWAVSITTVKVALESLSPLVANVIRLPVIILLLFMFYPSRIGMFKSRKYPLRSLAIVLGAGIVGIGLGGLLFLFSIQQAGAAKASILTSISPLFATAISIAFLKERINLRIGIGALLSVVGVWFVV